MFFRIFEEVVLGLDFDGLCALDLEGGEGVGVEDELFGQAGGEEFFSELGL